MPLFHVQVTKSFLHFVKELGFLYSSFFPPLPMYVIILDIASLQMYVPGKLNDVENVLVNVGTGYYVEKVIIFTY